MAAGAHCKVVDGSAGMMTWWDGSAWLSAIQGKGLDWGWYPQSRFPLSNPPHYKR
jgi:hypothetical protein